MAGFRFPDTPLLPWRLAKHVCCQSQINALLKWERATRTMSFARSRRVPGNMEEEHFVNLGVRDGGENGIPFGLSRSDRRQHLYIIGKSGTGKTTLLQNLITADFDAGHGVAIIDPHGDIAESLLDYVPPSRIDDVLYFNPADSEFPIGFNPLSANGPSHLLASEIVGSFKSIWRDSWGPRLEYILYAAVAALLDCENVSFLSLQRMFVDEHYRLWVVKQIKDPIVRSFWEHEFAHYDPKFLREAIAPIQNKVGQLLMAAPLRNIVGQVRNRIDARFMMDDRRIFIANLAKGRIGADKANLFGALLVSQFQLAAMSRADVPEDSRQDFSLCIDEFQNFSTDSFSSILSEARKYRLSLTLSHQYLNQLHTDLQHAVLGNAGSVISFRVGSNDAKVLASEFGDEYKASRFTELANYHIAVKLLANGGQMFPFFGMTLPPSGTRYGCRKKIINRSRERFATPRETVEERIRRWLYSKR